VLSAEFRRILVEEARVLGAVDVFIWTAGQQGYYERLGWAAVQRAECGGHAVVILQRRTWGEVRPRSAIGDM
jgi:N-acetylglutamate synthase-like GNAT family acetyltransferase